MGQGVQAERTARPVAAGSDTPQAREAAASGVCVTLFSFLSEVSHLMVHPVFTTVQAGPGPSQGLVAPSMWEQVQGQVLPGCVLAGSWSWERKRDLNPSTPWHPDRPAYAYPSQE